MELRYLALTAVVAAGLSGLCGPARAYDIPGIPSITSTDEALEYISKKAKEYMAGINAKDGLLTSLYDASGKKKDGLDGIAQGAVESFLKTGAIDEDALAAQTEEYMKTQAKNKLTGADSGTVKERIVKNTATDAAIADLESGDLATRTAALDQLTGGKLTDGTLTGIKVNKDWVKAPWIMEDRAVTLALLAKNDGVNRLDQEKQKLLDKSGATAMIEKGQMIVSTGYQMKSEEEAKTFYQQEKKVDDKTAAALKELKASGSIKDMAARDAAEKAKDNEAANEWKEKDKQITDALVKSGSGTDKAIPANETADEKAAREAAEKAAADATVAKQAKSAADSLTYYQEQKKIDDKTAAALKELEKAGTVGNVTVKK